MRRIVLVLALTALLASVFASPAFAVGGFIRGEGCSALKDAATTQENQELPQPVVMRFGTMFEPSQGAEHSAVEETGREHGCAEFPDPR